MLIQALSSWRWPCAYHFIKACSILACFAGLTSVSAQTLAQPSGMDATHPDRVALGQQLYASFCAGCHGENLQGQPNWKKRLPMGNFPATPHDQTGHTWHHADQWLFEIVKLGGKYHAPSRYRSAMPAYQDMLSDEEIWAVLSFIKSRWPAATQGEQERRNKPGR